MKTYILVSLAFILMQLNAFSQNYSDLEKQFQESKNTGDNINALKYAKKAFEIAEKKFSNRDSLFVRSLVNLGTALEMNEEFAEAALYYSEAFKAQIRWIEDHFPTLAQSISGISQMYYSITDDRLACLAYSRGLEQLLAIDKEDFTVIQKITSSYTDTFQEFYSFGTPEKKKDELEEARKKLGNKSDAYLAFLDSVALNRKTYGKYAEAMELFQQSYDLRKELNKTNVAEFADVCGNIGYLSFMSLKWDKVEEMYGIALPLWKKTRLPSNFDYVNALFFFGNCLQQKQNWSESLVYFREARDVIDLKDEVSKHYYIPIISGMGHSAMQSGDYKTAEECFLKEIKYRKEIKQDTIKGINMSTYSSLADLYVRMKKFEKAEETYIIANEEAVDQLEAIVKVLNSGSEKQLVMQLSWFKLFLDWYYSFYWRRYPESNKVAGYMYDNELIKKGLILRLMKAKTAAILNSGDADLVAKLDELLMLRQEMSKLEHLPLSERKTDTRLLDMRITALQNEIYSAIYLKKLFAEDISTNWKQVRENLKPGEAAVEFVSFENYDKSGAYFTDSIMYCALILRKDMDFPAMVDLFEEKEFEKFLNNNKGKNSFDMVRRLYTRSGGKYTNYYKGDSLYNYVWKPLEKHLKGVRTIYYSPSGLLHKISFSAISSGTDTLLIDRFNLQQVTSSNMLVHKTDPFKLDKEHEALLYGGILYDLENEKIEKNSIIYKKQMGDFFIRDRSFDWSDSLRGGGSWSYLEGTLKEVNVIDSLFENKSVNVNRIVADNALEESFKYYQGNLPEIIHIATHGYFFPEEKKTTKMSDLVKQGLTEIPDIDNALLRSGLLFAGANNTWQGKQKVEGAEDGILTALEVSHLRLYNTRLVVMSACETGLGDVKGGEGVYGLQRAFKMAGVDYVIMSLWQIPDAQTVELMSNFYSNWLSGMPIRESFYKAQLKMSENYEPFYWAAFVLVE